MNPLKGLALHANILLGAVFGIRVKRIMEAYEEAGKNSLRKRCRAVGFRAPPVPFGIL